MKHSMVLSAILMALALSACDKPTAVNPAAVVTVPVPGPAGPTGATGSTASPGRSTDPSLPAATPAASSASPAGLQSKANPQGVMTKQEESMAMPKPGQAGDESSEALHPPK